RSTSGRERSGGRTSTVAGSPACFRATSRWWPSSRSCRASRRSSGAPAPCASAPWRRWATSRIGSRPPAASARWGRSHISGRCRHRFVVWPLVPILPFRMAFAQNGHLCCYRGVLAVIGVCMVGLVLAAPVDGPLGRALAWPPLVYLGQRSYSVYLWHYPVIL